MKPFKLIRRYSESLLESVPKENLSKVADQLHMLTKSLNKESIQFFDNPLIKQQNKKDALNSIGKQLNLEQDLIEFFIVLVSNSRFSILPDIYDFFIELVNKKLNKALVTVITKYKLTDQQLDNVKIVAKNMFNQSINIKQQINPDLIGGILIKKGDLLLDLTIDNNIKLLRESLH